MIALVDFSPYGRRTSFATTAGLSAPMSAACTSFAERKGRRRSQPREYEIYQSTEQAQKRGSSDEVLIALPLLADVTRFITTINNATGLGCKAYLSTFQCNVSFRISYRYIFCVFTQFSSAQIKIHFLCSYTLSVYAPCTIPPGWGSSQEVGLYFS